MKITKLKNNRSERLLLCLAGWSAMPEAFVHLEAEADQDVWIGYDYRDLTLKEDLSCYKQIDLVAWSLGVWVADLLLSEYRFHSSTAVNGTGLPVNDTFGIPPVVFRGTLENVTDSGMSRFNRRMCGSKEVQAVWQQYPARTLDELKEELLTLYNNIDNREAQKTHWTKAIISTRDLIFPVANQHAWWQGRCPVCEADAPHYPFYLWKQWKEIIG